MMVNSPPPPEDRPSDDSGQRAAERRAYDVVGKLGMLRYGSAHVAFSFDEIVRDLKRDIRDAKSWRHAKRRRAEP